MKVKIKLREVRKWMREWKYKKVTYDPTMLEMVDLHLTVLSENLKYLRLSFYRQLKHPFIQILGALLYNTRKPHSINFPLRLGTRTSE